MAARRRSDWLLPASPRAPAKSDGVQQVPTNRAIAPGKDVRALEILCRAAALAPFISGSDDFAEQCVQLGNSDFQFLRRLINFSTLAALL